MYKGKFHLSFKEKGCLFFNEIIREINKNNALIGKAEGKKNIPMRNKLFPKLILYLLLKKFLTLINIRTEV